MLHTHTTGSGEEDFCRVFTIYGHGGQLSHVTKISQKNSNATTQGGST